MPRIDTAERTLGYVDQLDFARVIARFGSVEEGIDRLVGVPIEAKDRIDGDPDFEDNNDDEPTGRRTGCGLYRVHQSRPAQVDGGWR